MDSIFASENEVVILGEQLLNRSGEQVAKGQYAVLLEEYKKLLKQMRKVVNISDRMQADLKRLSTQLDELAKTDVLTGLYNRRFFNEIMQKEWDSARRSATNLSGLMVDVDNFKSFNDLYGHLAGDACLQKIAATLSKALLRPRDFVARYGGEEFFVLLPETDLLGAICVADNILEMVRKLDIAHAGNDDAGIVTVSIGVAHATPEDQFGVIDFFRYADEALFRAKKSGRSCWSE